MLMTERSLFFCFVGLCTLSVLQYFRQVRKMDCSPRFPPYLKPIGDGFDPFFAEKRPKVNCSAAMKSSSWVKPGENFCKSAYEVLRACNGHPKTGAKPLRNFFAHHGFGDPESFSTYLSAGCGFMDIPHMGAEPVVALLKNYFGSGAGTSIRMYQYANISDWAGLREGIVANRPTKKQQRPPVMWISPRVYGVHEFVDSKRRFLYITWFRDPVVRFVTHFKAMTDSVADDDDSLSERYIRSSGGNLTDFLVRSEGVQMPDVDNYYTRLLTFGKYSDVDEGHDDCWKHSEELRDRPVPPIMEDHYFTALQTIEDKIGFIGLDEDFHVSAVMLTAMMGIPRLPKAAEHDSQYVPRQGLGLSDFELSSLEKRMKWDIQLYEYIREMYFEQKEIYEMEWQSKLGAFVKSHS